MVRLHEYSPGFEPERFTAHEKFFVENVPRWTELVPLERGNKPGETWNVTAGTRAHSSLGIEE
jgi:hypothetical protein